MKIEEGGQSHDEELSSRDEGFGYHIVDNTKRPLFTEEDLLRGDLEGNYVLLTGQSPAFVGVVVRKPTESEMMISNIIMGPLKERLNEGVELTLEEEAILNDPRSMRGANVDYVTKRVNKYLKKKNAPQGGLANQIKTTIKHLLG